MSFINLNLVSERFNRWSGQFKLHANATSPQMPAKVLTQSYDLQASAVMKKLPCCLINFVWHRQGLAPTLLCTARAHQLGQ